MCWCFHVGSIGDCTRHRCLSFFFSLFFSWWCISLRNKKMDPVEFFVLFPHADKNHFYGRGSDSGKIYYINNDWEYINPTTKQFWNHEKEGVALLHLSQEGQTLLDSFPDGRKEQFLVVWKKRHEGEKAPDAEKPRSIPATNIVPPPLQPVSLSMVEQLEQVLHTYGLRMDLVFVFGLILYLVIKK